MGGRRGRGGCNHTTISILTLHPGTLLAQLAQQPSSLPGTCSDWGGAPSGPALCTLYTIHAAATPHSEVAAVQEQAPRANQHRRAFSVFTSDSPLFSDVRADVSRRGRKTGLLLRI